MKFELPTYWSSKPLDWKSHPWVHPIKQIQYKIGKARLTLLLLSVWFLQYELAYRQLQTSPHFFIDAYYIHEPPSEENKCEVSPIRLSILLPWTLYWNGIERNTEGQTNRIDVKELKFNDAKI